MIDLLPLPLTARTRRSIGSLCVWRSEGVQFKQSAHGAYVAIDGPDKNDRSQR
jgi:hypothetical protein